MWRWLGAQARRREARVDVNSIVIVSLISPKEKMWRGLKLIFETDRDLRSARPDDRTVVENFVMKLCA